MIHLSEAIISKRTGQYLDKWETKEDIIRFLEHNGYTFVDAPDEYTIRTTGYLLKKPVYAVGEYTKEAESHWIKFYDPASGCPVLFCRERPILKDIASDFTSKYATITRDGAWIEFKGGFKEFREYIKNNLGI